jgi:hypothetical protein
VDIYSFINSSDVAAYCREINKTWNPFEMAVIIDRSHITISERHEAWRELLNNYPDTPIPSSVHYNSFDSLHKKLAEVIDFEERLLALFKKPEQGAVYKYKNWLNDEYVRSSSVFSCVEQTFLDIKDSDDRENASKLVVEKEYIDKKGKIEAHMDYDGNLYKISIEDIAPDKWFPDIDFDVLINDMAGRFYIDIPTPFKRGDILTMRHSLFLRIPQGFVFTLDYLYRDDQEFLARCYKGTTGDGTDLVGWCYFVDEDGLLYDNHAHDHDCFEYYRGKLEGKERLLQYISWYLKDEISLSALLTAQCRIMSQHKLDNGLSFRGWLFPKEHIIAKGQADHDEA